MAESYAYDEFGKATHFDRTGAQIAGTAIGNPYTFQARELDSESGLYHYRARTYSASLGRFLQPDPLGLVDGLNAMAFARHDTLNYIDPLGLKVKVECDMPGDSEKEKKKKQDEFVKKLNRDLHKNGKNKDKEYYVNKDGELKMRYTSGDKKGQDVQGTDKGLSKPMQEHVNMLNDDTVTTLHLVNNNWKHTDKDGNPTGVDPGLPFAQFNKATGEDDASGDIYFNVDARTAYDAQDPDKGSPVGQDPQNMVAGLHHEMVEHRKGDEFRAKPENKGASAEDIYNYAHGVAVGAENDLRKEEGMPQRGDKGGFAKDGGDAQGPEHPSTMWTTWKDKDGNTHWQGVHHTADGGVGGGIPAGSQGAGKVVHWTK